MEITLDTHALIWYIDKGLNKKLSVKALGAIKEAEANGIVYLPVIVLMEMLHLIEKGRVLLSFVKFLSLIESCHNYKVIPLDISLIKVAKTLTGLEVHDRLILATSILTNSSLISKDKELGKRGINVVW